MLFINMSVVWTKTAKDFEGLPKFFCAFNVHCLLDNAKFGGVWRSFGLGGISVRVSNIPLLNGIPMLMGIDWGLEIFSLQKLLAALSMEHARTFTHPLPPGAFSLPLSFF